MKKNVCVGLLCGALACFPFALGNSPIPQAISDLQGTTWRFNENIIFPNSLQSEGKIVFDVSLTVTGNDYTTFVLWYDYFGNGGYQMAYVDLGGSDDVFYDTMDSPSWSSDLYKDVSFTVGSDSTNATLIDFMEENAVLLSSPSSNLDLYDQIYQLLSDFLFGGQVGQDDMTYKALVLTAGATILSVFMIAIPFMAVYAFMRLFF